MSHIFSNLKKIKGMQLKKSQSCEGGGSAIGCQKYITLEAALHIQAVSLHTCFLENRHNYRHSCDVYCYTVTLHYVTTVTLLSHAYFVLC